MLNQPAAGNVGPEARLRLMRILWAVFLVNVGIFVVVACLVSEGLDGPEGVPPLLYALAALALSSVVVSFLVKASFYRSATERQEPARVQTGFIIALALCESAALWGLVGVLVTRCDYAYALCALGALGMALHFPRREQVLASYYKTTL